MGGYGCPHARHHLCSRAEINGTAQDALDQINSRRYVIPYATSGKRVVKVGVSFSKESKTVEDWIIIS